MVAVQTGRQVLVTLAAAAAVRAALLAAQDQLTLSHARVAAHNLHYVVVPVVITAAAEVLRAHSGFHLVEVSALYVLSGPEVLVSSHQLVSVHHNVQRF